MTEVFEHNPEEHEDPAPGPTWVVGLVGVLVLAATLLGLTALYYNVKAEQVDQVVVAPPREELKELREAQAKRLTGPPRWVERQEEGQVVEALVIPIEEAMDLIVAEAGGGSP